jgi:hypothetical protein
MADEDKKPKTVKVGDVLAKDKAAPKAKPESKDAAKPSQKKKHKHTHIEHHYDEQGKSKGHTVRHQPMGGGEEVSYAAPDLDAVHDGMEEHVGTPNDGEEVQESSQASTPNPAIQQI